MSFQLPITNYQLPRNGQAIFSFVFLVGTIVVAIGVTLAFLAFSFINISFGFRAGERASAAAAGGANDGVMQLVRNKSFSNVSGYSVPGDAAAATVSVSQNTPVSGEATIISTATVSGYERRIKAVVAVDPTTGQVTLINWNKIVF